MNKPSPTFNSAQLESLSKAIADTDRGLTGTELGYMLSESKIKDVDPTNTKWKRLYNAFVQEQNESKMGNRILGFISKAMNPARYVGEKDTFVWRQHAINEPLAFYGLQFEEDGKFHKVPFAKTLSEAEDRANRLRTILRERNVHPDVLIYCRAELLDQNYFHAVLEATKSVADKIRLRTGISTDGAVLVDQAFGGQSPLLRINSLVNESHWSEHKGFASLLKGMFAMFRNPTAHAPRVTWGMCEEDALALFTLASYAHRRIDKGLLI